MLVERGFCHASQSSKRQGGVPEMMVGPSPPPHAKARLLTALVLAATIMVLPSASALIQSIIAENTTVSLIKCDSDSGVGLEESEACAVECEGGDHITAETRVKNVDDGESYKHYASIDCADAAAANLCNDKATCNTDDAGGKQDTTVPGDGSCDGWAAASKFEHYTVELWCGVGGGDENANVIDAIFEGLAENDSCVAIADEIPELTARDFYAASTFDGQAKGVFVSDGECFQVEPGFTIDEDGLTHLFF